jgi:hypothetical protein
MGSSRISRRLAQFALILLCGWMGNQKMFPPWQKPCQGASSCRFRRKAKKVGIDDACIFHWLWNVPWTFKAMPQKAACGNFETTYEYASIQAGTTISPDWNILSLSKGWGEFVRRVSPTWRMEIIHMNHRDSRDFDWLSTIYPSSSWFLSKSGNWRNLSSHLGCLRFVVMKW